MQGREKYERLANIWTLFVPSAQENFGMIVPEALICGTPVYASLGTPWGELNDCDLNKTVRYYSSKNFAPWRFRFGFMPAHPSFYTYKHNFEKYGYSQYDYKIAADYDLPTRFLYSNKLKSKYLHLDFMKMRTGGKSTANLKSNWILNKEIVRACRENGIWTCMPLLGLKYFVKVFELIFTKE